MIRSILFLALLSSALAGEPSPALVIPAGMRFINGTGQLPVIHGEFKAPGFTSQGYIEIREAAGPNVCFVGLNSSDAALTLRTSYRASCSNALTRITYAKRNKELGLTNAAIETVVQPWQFYVSDPMPLTVKANDVLALRTFVPLTTNTLIGCGIISISELRCRSGRWDFGNITGADDRTLDPDFETQLKPSNDLLVAPFLVAGENVRADARFIVAIGDSLTTQLASDKGGTWFQNTFIDIPHCNTAIGGDALGNMLTAEGEIRGRMNEARFAVLRYATDVINFYGHNDLGNSVTVAALLNTDTKFCARPEVAKARKWRCTLTPFTHNKPGVEVAKLMEADQTPDRFSPAIIEFNQEMRANYKKYGYDGLIEIGALLATGPDSPFWKPGMANDGTHFSRVPCNDLIAPEARKILK